MLHTNSLQPQPQPHTTQQPSPSQLTPNRKTKRQKNTHLRKRRLAHIRDHREGRDRLLLHIAPQPAVPLAVLRLEQLQQARDDRVEVRDQRVPLDALAEVDERRGGVGVYAVFLSCLDAGVDENKKFREV